MLSFIEGESILVACHQTLHPDWKNVEQTHCYQNDQLTYHNRILFYSSAFYFYETHSVSKAPIDFILLLMILLLP